MLLELTSLETLRRTVAGWKQAGERVALVPTMGALHAGHLALVARAKTVADRVVVSIFVNPTQFGPNEDFAKYPRTLADDLAQLRATETDAAWLPSVETMYPTGAAIAVTASGPTNILEGAVRPGHFDGVATVVAVLFRQVQPDIAIFGEKDYQQLCVIRHLVADEKLPVEIVAEPTLRESDGLAMSSRNRYLNPAQRAIATRLNQTLRDAAWAMREDQRPVEEALAHATQQLRDGGFDAVDYVALADARTLYPLDRYQPNARLLAAARLGTTRLIDNIAV